MAGDAPQLRDWLPIQGYTPLLLFQFQLSLSFRQCSGSRPSYNMAMQSSFPSARGGFRWSVG